MNSSNMQPNVILIVMDTARASNLSCYGYKSETTPNLDKIASQSIIYKNAFSVSPWSLPSHASMFTGRYPSDHLVDRNLRTLKDLKEPVLAEYFKKNGYTTVGFSNNTWISHQFGFDRGFDQFFYGWQILHGKTDFLEINRYMKEMSRVESIKYLSSNFFKGTPARNFINGLFVNFAFSYDKGAWLTNKQIQNWIKGKHNSSQPFFMFINYMEPHLKYMPPTSYRRRFLQSNISERDLKSINQDAFAYISGSVSMDEQDFETLEALYDAELYYLDKRFQDLISFLNNHDILDNSMLIITSDHGENIGDHNLMDHEYCLYNTLLHVPLIIRLPGETQNHRIMYHIVETKDIFTTVLDFMNFERTPGQTKTSTGYSLLPEKLDKKSPEYCLSEYLQPQPSIEEINQRYPGFGCPHHDRALRSIISADGHKYIWASDGRHELYDLNVSPKENQNILKDHNDKAEELKLILDSKLPDYGALEVGGKNYKWENVDPIIQKRLEELGYL